MNIILFVYGYFGFACPLIFSKEAKNDVMKYVEYVKSKYEK